MKQSYALFLFISTLWFYKIMLSDCTTDVLHKENKVVSVSLPAIISSCIAGGGGGSLVDCYFACSFKMQFFFFSFFYSTQPFGWKADHIFSRF